MNFGQIAFAIGIIASGVLNIVSKNFYSPWDPIASFAAPAHEWLAIASGALMVLGGGGLLVKRTAMLSARVLFWLLLGILVLLKTPVLLTEPLVEVSWLDYGEIAVIVAGAWTLATTSPVQIRAARYLMGAAILPIGISHFTYITIAMPMVPAALPFHRAWVIFTGVAHIAAGLAVLAGVLVWLATVLEASMVTAFALFVWVVPMLAKPSDPALWVPIVVTLAVAGGVWAVASKLRRFPLGP